MTKSDFATVFAEDLYALVAARAALTADAVRHSGIDHPDGAFTRVLMVLTVQVFETALEVFPESEAYRQYIAKGRGVRNDARVRALELTLANAGLSPESSIMEDYIAVKYYRNTLQHADWFEWELPFVRARGFPEDPRRLSSQHWDRVLAVAQALLGYLREWAHQRSLEALQAGDTEDSRFYIPGDVLLALSTPVDWYSRLARPSQANEAWGRTLDAIAEGLASSGGQLPPDRLCEVAGIAIECHNARFEAAGIGLAAVDEAEATLAAMLGGAVSLAWPPGVPMGAVVGQGSGDDTPPEFKSFASALQRLGVSPDSAGHVWDTNLPDDVVELFLRACLAEPSTSPSALLRALRVGHRLYAKALGQTSAHAFNGILQFLPPTTSGAMQSAAMLALAACHVERGWYELVERRAAVPPPVADVMPWDRVDMVSLPYLARACFLARPVR